MATDRSATVYRALIVPDPRIGYAESYESTLSTLTQAGPLPGVPEPQQDTGMVLRAYGAQAASSAVRIRTLQGGYAGPDAATFAWTNNGDTLWRGWDAPDAISDFEFITRSTTAGKWRPHDAAVDHGGIFYALALEDDQTVVLHRRLTATLWDTVDVFDNGAAYGNPAACALLVLPQRDATDDGRILAFYSVLGTFYYLAMSYSDDGGTTWTQGSARCSIDGFGNYFQRIRAVYYQGAIVLLIQTSTGGTPANKLVQWVSTDGGAHFREIDATTTANFGLGDLVVSGGRLYAAFVKETGEATDYQAFICSVGSPAEPIFSAARSRIYDAGEAEWEWATEAGAPAAIDRGELVLVADDDGKLYCYGQHCEAGTTYPMYLLSSTDGGATWTETGAVVDLEDASTTLRYVSGRKQLGRVGLVSAHTANPGTADDSLSVCWMGGYATVTRPLQTVMPGYGAAEKWSLDYLPFDEPDDIASNWTAGGAGAPTLSLTSTGLRIQHTDALMNTEYTGTITSGLAQGAPIEAGLKVVAGTGFVKATISDGVGEHYTVSVEVTPTTITLKDVVGASTIATVNTTVGATGVTVRLDLGKDGTGKVRAWYRALDSAPDRAFIAIGSSDAVTAGGATTRRFQWGTLVGDAATDVYFRRVSCRLAGWGVASANWFTGQSNPADLQGRPYCPVPTFVGAAGLKIGASDGPTYAGDDWHVDTRYEHGVELIDYRIEPSPNRGWRSTGVGSNVELAWRFTTETNGSRLLGPAVGLVLLGCNFASATLSGLNNLSVWTSLATVDATDGQDGLAYTRENDTILVDTGGATPANFYFDHGSLEGCYLDCGGGIVYKIVRQVEGAWNLSATHKHVRLIVEGVDNASDPTSGTCDIISRDHLLVVQDVGKYRAFKLTITAQDTYEGDFRIGTMILGHVHYFGLPYSFGRIREVEGNTDLYTRRSGRRTAKRRGPPRRSVTFDFGDWMPQRGTEAKPPNADYILGATGSSVAAASIGDTIQALAGLYEHCNGAEVPVVWVERLEIAPNTSTVLREVRRTKIIYGRFAGAFRYEHRRGDEGRTGVYTSAPASIEEET